MAEQQLKTELFAMLKQQGLQDLLKAQMRSQLLSRLKGAPQVRTEDLTGRILSSLVLDYLKKTNLQFTVSVFLPETGGMALLTPPELVQLLGANDVPETDSLLSFIVTEFQRTSIRPHLHDSAAQTEDYRAVADLEDRLHSVELQYISKMKSLPNPQTMEEKMMRYQSECEARLRLEMEHEIARIREVEMKSMRLEESSKYRQQLQAARLELEAQWQSRLEQIKGRDKEGSDRLSLRENDIETLNFIERQKLQREIERLNSKEQVINRQSQVEAQAAKLEKDTWEVRRIEAETKIKDLDKLKLTLEHKAELDFDQFKREYENRHLEEKHKLMNDQADLERMKRKLGDDQERVAEFSREFLKLKQDLAEMKENNDDLRTVKEKQSQEIRLMQDQLRQLTETGRRDLDLLSLREQELATLKSELQLYRDMFEESKAATKALDARHQDIVGRMNSELKQLRKTQNMQNTDAHVVSLVGTEMSLRWKQLERDEEELRRKALEWIKPVYKKPRDPFSDLVAPKREPVVSEPRFVPREAARYSAPQIEQEEQKSEDLESDPHFLHQEASVPEASGTLPPVQNPMELISHNEEEDIAQYALRQQRKRQFEQFGEHSEVSEESHSSSYSDRIE